jgi:hypothetical protein
MTAARCVAVWATATALTCWCGDYIAVDVGLRGARTNGQTAGEIRAGVTFAFGVTKGPDILSGLIASVFRY